MEALGLGPPELLSIQKLLQTFSAENGEELLGQYFGNIEKRMFSNSLRFRYKEVPHIEVYLRMKKRLLFKEVYDAGPDVVGAALNQIMAALAAEAKEKGTVEFNKNDAVFLCRGPLVAREACGSRLTEKKIEGKKRAICANCGFIAYENPLPVAAALVVNDRKEVLLVRRARQPMKGMWCLPCGFAEKDEQIEEAVLRELEEETRLTGSVTRLLDAVTAQNFFYGNLVMITFEIGHVRGSPSAGDDADEVRYFPIDQIPPLAFPSQERAVTKYREFHAKG
jgi:ADP-ribose pyrophosphatase YjhB (NUDIX family)